MNILTEQLFSSQSNVASMLILLSKKWWKEIAQPTCRQDWLLNCKGAWDHKVSDMEKILTSLWIDPKVSNAELTYFSDMIKETFIAVE